MKTENGNKELNDLLNKRITKTKLYSFEELRKLMFELKKEIIEENKEKHRRDLLSVGRTYLWTMVFFFMINLFGTLYSIGNTGFMFFFNFTCLMVTIIFIIWLDYNKYKIIEGRIN